MPWKLINAILGGRGPYFCLPRQDIVDAIDIASNLKNEYAVGHLKIILEQHDKIHYNKPSL